MGGGGSTEIGEQRTWILAEREFDISLLRNNLACLFAIRLFFRRGGFPEPSTQLQCMLSSVYSSPNSG